MKKYKINKDLFKNNNNVVFSHFKMNWKLILFFIIFWFLISLVLMLATMINNSGSFEGVSFSAKKSMIAPGMYWMYDEDGNSGGVTSTTSISSILNHFLLGTPAIVFFAIVGMFYINKIFLTSISRGKIVFWTTLPLSRNQIMFSKYLFIIFTLFTIFMPSYILIVIFSSFSYDASEYIGNVILYGFQFFIFIVFFISVYTLISVALMENKLVANVIMSLITLATVICAILFYLYQLNEYVYLEDPTFKNPNENFKYAQYFSLQCLLIRPLSFSFFRSDYIPTTDPIETINANGKIYNVYLQTNDFLPANKSLLTIFTITMPVISSGIVFLNNYIFRQKDLNI